MSTFLRRQRHVDVIETTFFSRLSTSLRNRSRRVGCHTFLLCYCVTVLLCLLTIYRMYAQRGKNICRAY